MDLTRCDICGTNDPDTDIGWSVCRKCFRANPFNGWAYWVPFWCMVTWLTAVGWLVAALIELTR